MTTELRKTQLIPGKRLSLGHLDATPKVDARSELEIVDKVGAVTSGDASLIAMNVRLSAAVSSLVSARLDVVYDRPRNIRIDARRSSERAHRIIYERIVYAEELCTHSWNIGLFEW